MFHPSVLSHAHRRIIRKRHHARNAAEIVGTFTEGVFSTMIDATLWLVVYTSSMSVPQSSIGQLWRAEHAADEFLSSINYETIKRSIAEARRRGLLRSGKRVRKTWPQITEAGKRRLASALPKYEQTRPWDGRMYLVTYDIPEKQKGDRDLLRESMRILGCGKLQESVYVTPYDPREIVAEYVRTHHLSGTIVVSDIGKDGSVGNETLKELVYRVYALDQLNERYEEWLREASGSSVDRWLAVAYFSILRDDPQLPFALLPKWWKGDEAYKRVKPYVDFLVNSTSGRV